MKSVSRVLAVGAVTALAVPLVPQPALADTTSEPAAVGAYFWSGKLPSTFSIGGQTQPNPVNGQDTDLDGVARDELAVAVTSPGSTDKESFLAWDLLELTENDTITKFVVTSPLSENGPSDDSAKNTYTYGVEPPLQACSPKGGFGSTDAGAYETKPEVDLTKCTPGKVSEDGKAYVFDVTMLASTWLTGDNFGIAIVPVDTTTSFQVVFQTADKHVAAIEYTKGEDPFADLPVEEPLDVTEDVAVGGGFSDGGSIDSGFSGSVDTGSVDAPIVDTTVPEPAEAVGPEPETAPVQTEQVALTTVPGTPPLGFWLFALAIAAVLLLVSLVTGAGPAASQRREGRVLAQIQRDARPGFSPRPARGLA